MIDIDNGDAVVHFRLDSQPVSNVRWADARELDPNIYNPNFVMNAELKLLERNILTHGWVQPILVTKEGTIIDGFHRRMLAIESKAMIARYRYMVPCASINLPPDKAMLLTIRMGRAKGTHASARMSGIVRRLIDDFDYDRAEVASQIGATLAEVDLLYQDLFTHYGLDKYRYSRSWVPANVKDKDAVPVDVDEQEG